jgi:hypothetical protein
VTSADALTHARAVRIEDEVQRRDIRLRGRVNRCGPCPRCGGVDRFAINIKKQKWNCRGCGVGGDVIALVRHLDGCDFHTAVRTLAGERPYPAPTSRTAAPSSRTEVEDYERNQHRKAARLWVQRRPIRGTIAEKYLRGRGIICALPPTLAYLPPAEPDHHPALIAAFGFAEVAHGMENDPKDLARIKQIINTWLKNKVFAKKEQYDENRKKREFIIPGQWSDIDAAAAEEHEFDS